MARFPRKGQPLAVKIAGPAGKLLASNQRAREPMEKGGPVSTTPTRHVSEQEARQVAEAARETEGRKPSFGKELFLGRFRLDLIHPHPKPDQSDTERGET